jgi:hypothetical protein
MDDETTVELQLLRLEQTVKMCSSYYGSSSDQSYVISKKKSKSSPGKFHYALINH